MSIGYISLLYHLLYISIVLLALDYALRIVDFATVVAVILFAVCSGFLTSSILSKAGSFLFPCQQILSGIFLLALFQICFWYWWFGKSREHVANALCWAFVITLLLTYLVYTLFVYYSNLSAVS